MIVLVEKFSFGEMPWKEYIYDNLKALQGVLMMVECKIAIIANESFGV